MGFITYLYEGDCMKMKKIFLVALLTLAQAAQACLFTITNDSDAPIMLFNLAGDKGAVVNPGDTTSFGNPKKHARFCVAQQSEPNHFNTTHIIKQFACSATHNILLSISELYSGHLSEDNASLVTVTPFSQTKFLAEAEEENEPAQ